ncbi:MAG TPA: bacillithiol biosynthesis cysteine-adding enzyme BshC [Flavobacteriales bacterium]
MLRHLVPYRATGRFPRAVLDHLEDAPALRDFRTWRPDAPSLRAANQARDFDPHTRAVLCEVLEEQYRDLPLKDAVRNALDLLRRAECRTVTTGHQLCLFSGPLYVPFKILNAVRIARQISTDRAPVVPVFWMATEDHDRAEIDHTYVNGERVHWPGPSGGPVGRMRLDGIAAAVHKAGSLLGQGSHADQLRTLLAECYRPEHSLAHATRLFVDALFGRFGVVLLDADDPRLKRVFAPLMQEELLHGITVRTVRYANERLAGIQDEQAHARDINLFHLRDGHRSRIERQDERYQVLDQGPSFDLEHLLAELERHPDRFSPNVLMRPLYQEVVLPNVAYIGGGGELAYWLQLRWLFEAYRVPMPVLLLRASAAFLKAKDIQRCTELGLEPSYLFRPVDELRNSLAMRNASFSTQVDDERRRIFQVYEELALRARTADSTLEQAVRAAAKRSMKGLDALESKLVRAAKREQEQVLQSLERVLDRLFPDGILQERRENFMPWYAAQGPAFFDTLLEALDPLDARFSLFVEP